MFRPRLLPVVVFVLLIAATAQAQICGDALWPDGEFCGQDAFAVTGDTDMNHDCVVDFLDVSLFWPYIGMTGPGLSADFNVDQVVNLYDISQLASSLASGNPVSPCNPTPAYPDSCGSSLALSMDPTIIVSRGRAAAVTPVDVYVIADGWVDATAIEYGIEFSPNLFHLGRTGTTGWNEALTFTTGNTAYLSFTGTPLTGTTVVVTHQFLPTDALPAWVELVDYNAPATLKNRWAPSTLDRRAEFQVRRHVGINGIDPISVTACPATNASPTVVITDPAGTLTVPWATNTYALTGTGADSDSPLSFVEVRVNNGSWQSATGTTPWSLSIPLIVGENWVQVRAADSGGAYSQTQVVAITRQDRPDLTITAWSAPDTLDHGCLDANFSATVQNIGASTSPGTRLGFYLSTDAVIDASDHQVGVRYVSVLAAGASEVINETITIPDDGPRGAVYLGAFVDDHNNIDESNEANNTVSGAFEYPPPAITTVEDVGNDQGRAARINLLASSRDVLGSATPILQYEFFRRIDPLPTLASPSPRSDADFIGGTQVSDPGKLAGWEFVGAVPAHGHSEYNAIVPTLGDSTSAGTHWSVFFVRAATVQPLVFFDSCPDSGYSVDNLLPSVPAGLVVAYAAAGNRLSWYDNLEDDFRYYRVYRGSHIDFVPGESNLVEAMTVAEWLDTASDPWAHHYKITAVDQAGNESPAATPQDVSGALEMPSAPTRFALHQCVPNPFNPVTRIEYDLPEDAFVTLVIYATNGRLVATLVNEIVPQGAQEAVWDGKDRFGRRVAAGVYFYRMDAGMFSETRRMVLVK